MVEKGNPPTRHGRWCCDEYKEQGGHGLPKVIGVRIAESKRRSTLWKQVNQRKDGVVLAPIAYWTDDDVWAFIKDRAIPYCKLYDNGFKRLGCVGCPLGGETRQREEFAVWPAYEMMWIRSFRLMYEKNKEKISKRTGRKYWWVDRFRNGNEFYEWWITKGASESSKDQCVFEDMMEQR
jgi:phosphoadenosine phosphosulfate reductase